MATSRSPSSGSFLSQRVNRSRARYIVPVQMARKRHEVAAGPREGPGVRRGLTAWVQPDFKTDTVGDIGRVAAIFTQITPSPNFAQDFLFEPIRGNDLRRKGFALGMPLDSAPLV